jgi:anti-anti-sigma factor
MAIQNWSDNVLLVELQNDPTFADDMNALMEMVENNAHLDVVLNFAAVTFVNSSNLAKMLKLRKMVLSNDRRLKLCGISTQVWGVFLVTGLDKIFDLADDVSTCLASLQIENDGP